MRKKKSKYVTACDWYLGTFYTQCINRVVSSPEIITYVQLSNELLKAPFQPLFTEKTKYCDLETHESKYRYDSQ